MSRMATYTAPTGSVSVHVANGVSRTYGPGSRINLDEKVTPTQTLEDALGRYLSLFTVDVEPVKPAKSKPEAEISKVKGVAE